MPLKGRKNVDKAIEQTVVNVNRDLRGAYLSGLTAMIKQSPVDEGRAKNNWFLTIGAPSRETTTSKSDSGTNSISQASGMPKNILGKKLFFTNNLSYIETLEYGGYPSPVKNGTWNKKKKEYEIRSDGGFSKQALTGWVRKTLRAMAKKVRTL